jgi:hypothetical protein
MSIHQVNEGHNHRVNDCGGSGEAARFWEHHYRRHEQVWSGNANAVLFDVVAQLVHAG